MQLTSTHLQTSKETNKQTNLMKLSKVIEVSLADAAHLNALK
jgi:hypothetical protein